MSRVNRFQEGHGPHRETHDVPTKKRRKPRVRDGQLRDLLRALADRVRTPHKEKD